MAAATPVSLSSQKTKKRSEKKDLLLTKKRSNNSKALVVVDQVTKPSNPPPASRTELVVSTLGSWDMFDLPLKKRIIMVAQARERNQFLCITCGRAFSSYRALGGHMSHHKLREIDGDHNSWLLMGYNPSKQQQRPRQCPMCGRAFSSPQGLGGHRKHCKGPPAQPESTAAAGAIHCFNLNELPKPEQEEEMLTLAWYDAE